ncbi:hypothetical protein CFAM422_002070 [Trichoderma lentiforme]|uniref:Uncharacterized protein n=1 Tax=Trichoderma lentiforme TaxID=1567552 RepID=A0A9P5CH79_9HYPO|nr:hypothetical protein CFAM422_002070 [Trichoderma lentiforme]
MVILQMNESVLSVHRVPPLLAVLPSVYFAAQHDVGKLRASRDQQLGSSLSTELLIGHNAWFQNRNGISPGTFIKLRNGAMYLEKRKKIGSTGDDWLASSAFNSPESTKPPDSQEIPP